MQLFCSYKITVHFLLNLPHGKKTKSQTNPHQPRPIRKGLVEAKKAGPKFSDPAAWAVPSNPTWANARAL